MTFKIAVDRDAPPSERAATAAYLLGTLVADFNLLPEASRSALRDVAHELIQVLDEYDRKS